MSIMGEMGARVQVRVGVQLSILLCELGWDLNCGVERIFMMTGMTGDGRFVGMLGVAFAQQDGEGAGGAVTDSWAVHLWLHSLSWLLPVTP